MMTRRYAVLAVSRPIGSGHGGLHPTRAKALGQPVETVTLALGQLLSFLATSAPDAEMEHWGSQPLHSVGSNRLIREPTSPRPWLSLVCPSMRCRGLRRCSRRTRGPVSASPRSAFSTRRRGSLHCCARHRRFAIVGAPRLPLLKRSMDESSDRPGNELKPSLGDARDAGGHVPKPTVSGPARVH
jgi:hypothetical protein